MGFGATGFQGFRFRKSRPQDILRIFGVWVSVVASHAIQDLLDSLPFRAMGGIRAEDLWGWAWDLLVYACREGRGLGFREFLIPSFDPLCMRTSAYMHDSMCACAYACSRSLCRSPEPETLKP